MRWMVFFEKKKIIFIKLILLILSKIIFERLKVYLKSFLNTSKTKTQKHHLFDSNPIKLQYKISCDCIMTVAFIELDGSPLTHHLRFRIKLHFFSSAVLVLGSSSTYFQVSLKLDQKQTSRFDRWHKIR